MTQSDLNGAGAAAVAINTASRMDAAGDDHLKKVIENQRDKMRAKADDTSGKSSAADGTPSNDRPQDIAGGGDTRSEKEAR